MKRKLWTKKNRKSVQWKVFWMNLKLTNFSDWGSLWKEKLMTRSRHFNFHQSESRKFSVRHFASLTCTRPFLHFHRRSSCFGKVSRKIFRDFMNEKRKSVHSDRCRKLYGAFEPRMSENRIDRVGMDGNSFGVLLLETRHELLSPLHKSLRQWVFCLRNNSKHDQQLREEKRSWKMWIVGIFGPEKPPSEEISAWGGNLSIYSPQASHPTLECDEKDARWTRHTEILLLHKSDSSARWGVGKEKISSADQWRKLFLHRSAKKNRGRSQHAHKAIFGVADEKRKWIKKSSLGEAQRNFFEIFFRLRKRLSFTAMKFSLMLPFPHLRLMIECETSTNQQFPHPTLGW